MERPRNQESKSQELTFREETIADLKLRASDLRKKGYMNHPELIILQKALSLERQVLGSIKKTATNEGCFSTGYAGRKRLEWSYDQEKNEWAGEIYNRESGILKKEAVGTSAEEMLRGLLPS